MSEPNKSTGVPGYQKRAVTKRTPLGEGDGVTKSYAQSVSPPRPPTRDEVEAQLRATSESITSRVERLQSAMGIDGEALKEFAAKPFVSVALALGAGYAIGKLLGSLRRESDDGTAALAELIADEVGHALDGEESINDAVQRVLRAAGRQEPVNAESTSLIRWFAGTALRAAIGQSMRELSRRFVAGEGERE